MSAQPPAPADSSLGSSIRPKMPGMISIPAGEFFMGTTQEQVQRLLMTEDWAEEWFTKDLFQVEQPHHRLRIPGYEIGRYPVTNEEYQLFIWDSGYHVPRGWIGFRYLDEQEDHPVVGITRMDALHYIRWLNDKLSDVLRGAKFRLPTEAEWERAARGWDNRMYPWGDEFNPWRCNTSESSKKNTTPVGTYSPSGDSPWGVGDLVGNSWEWTSSLLRSYPYVPDDGREDPDSPDVCVIRGGAWYYTHKLARCTSREGVLPSYSSASVGFRLARTLTK